MAIICRSTHPFDCSQLGDDLLQTRRILAALASHPNAGGVLVVGLGCENNQLQTLLEVAGGSRPPAQLQR
jgi:altronate hydrolase